MNSTNGLQIPRNPNGIFKAGYYTKTNTKNDKKPFILNVWRRKRMKRVNVDTIKHNQEGILS